MKDNFEKIVRDNRDSFDYHEPSGKLWNRISRELPSGVGGVHWLWKAAAVIFFMSTLALGYQQWDGNKEQRMAHREVSVADFDQVENFYFSEISAKRSLIDQLEPDNIAEIDALAELQKLDAMYLVLKKQYEDEPTPEVIDAMTLNLLVRIDLLNRTIEKLDRQEGLEI